MGCCLSDDSKNPYSEPLIDDEPPQKPIIIDRPKIIYKNWAFKQGHSRKNWTKRFVILSSGSLAYYVEPTDKYPFAKGFKGHIDLSNCALTTYRSKKKVLCLQLTTDANFATKIHAGGGKKVLHFYGLTERDTMKWAKFMAVEIDRLLLTVPDLEEINKLARTVSNAGNSPTLPVDINLNDVNNHGGRALKAFRDLAMKEEKTAAHCEHNNSFYDSSGKGVGQDTPDTPPHDLLINPELIRSGEIAKSGWGLKQGSFRPSWKNRFFILSNDGWLYYYAKGPPNVRDRRGQIPIDGCEILLEDSRKDKNGRHFVHIKSKIKMRNLLVEFVLAEDAADWARCLKLQVIKIGSFESKRYTEQSI